MASSMDGVHSEEISGGPRVLLFKQSSHYSEGVIEQTVSVNNNVVCFASFYNTAVKPMLLCSQTKQDKSGPVFENNISRILGTVSIVRRN